MKILFLSLLGIFIVSGLLAQADTSYVSLIDTTIEGKPFYKVESVSTGTDGSMKLERTAPIDSSELVNALINGAKEAKLNLRGPIRALIQESTWNRSFNTNNQLLQQLTGGQTYFDLNTRYNKQTFLNLPDKDTLTTKVISGTTYTSWIVWVGNTSTACRVNEDGVFVQIASQTNFTVSPDATNAKRGRMLLYDQDFARFSGAGDFPLLDGSVDMVKVGGIADETGRVVRELWMSRDRQVRVLKNLPK